MKKRCICAVLILAMIFSCKMTDFKVKAANSEEISFTVEYGQTDARKMADKLNNYRAENNLDALEYDYNLEKVAMQRAAEIAVKFNSDGDSHTRPDGLSYKQTLADFGFNISPRGTLYGENILFGTEDSMLLDSAFSKLCSDEGNRTQMLGYYTMVGIGHVKIEEKTDFWVQVFANKGTPGDYTSPVDGEMVVTVLVDPSYVTDINVSYSEGGNTVAVGNSTAVPVYIPKIKVTGSEMKDALVLSPLNFDSDDGFVKASNGIMTGLKEGTGSITANLLGKNYSYNVTVTAGNGSGNPTSAPTNPVTQAPTNTPTTTPTQPVTQTPTNTPTTTPTQPVTQAPTNTPTTTPTEPVTQAPTNTPTTTPTQPVTQAPTNTPTTTPTEPVTQAPTAAPTTAPTPAPTAAPTQPPVTQTPTPAPTTAPTQPATQTPTATPTAVPTEVPSTGLKKGDTFNKNGIKYEVTGNTTVSVVGLTSKKTTAVSIPATVKYSGVKYKITKINAGAFEGRTNLTSIILGKNIKTIGQKAFKGCTKLTEIKIPKNVKTIGKYAFYGCKKLKDITLSGTSITSIGTKAFSKVDSKAIIKVPSSSYKVYKKLLDASGSKCTINKS